MLDAIRRTILHPALALLPESLSGREAEVLLLASGLAASGFQTRRDARGPGRGYWRALPDGVMVGGVLRAAQTRDLAVAVCDARQVPPIAERVYSALEHDDLLAAALARLLLWSDPAGLPSLGDEAGAWACYQCHWAVDEAARRDWPAHYQRALAACPA